MKMFPLSKVLAKGAARSAWGLSGGRSLAGHDNPLKASPSLEFLHSVCAASVRFGSSRGRRKKIGRSVILLLTDRPESVRLSPSLEPEPSMNDELKDLFLGTFEASLEAQLRAVRRLRQGEAE